MSARRPSLLRAQTDEPRSPQHLLAPHGPLHRTRSATALASIQYIATQTGGLSPRDTLPRWCRPSSDADLSDECVMELAHLLKQFELDGHGRPYRATWAFCKRMVGVLPGIVEGFGSEDVFAFMEHVRLVLRVAGCDGGDVVEGGESGGVGKGCDREERGRVAKVAAPVQFQFSMEENWNTEEDWG